MSIQPAMAQEQTERWPARRRRLKAEGNYHRYWSLFMRYRIEGMSFREAYRLAGEAYPAGGSPSHNGFTVEPLPPAEPLPPPVSDHG